MEEKIEKPLEEGETGGGSGDFLFVSLLMMFPLFMMGLLALGTVCRRKRKSQR